MKNISLTIDARMISHSGIGVYLQELFKRLASEDRFDISLIGDADKLMSTFSQHSQRLKIIECSAPIYSIKEQILLPSLIDKCDVFWSPHYNIPLFPIKAKYRIVTIHDVYHLACRHELGLAQKLYAQIVLSLAVRLSDKIITVSNFSRDEIIRYTRIRKDKIEVIYNGVDFDRFNLSQSNLTKTDSIIQGKYVLFVGNVKPHKNIIRLLESFELVLKELPELKLLVVGKKENFINGVTGLKELIDMKKMDQNIIFSGYVEDEDLPAVYKNAELLVFPSLYEGFGLPPLEAMSAGIPVLASTSASIPEVCGDASMYADPLNITEIAWKMIEILKSDNIRNSLVQKGYLRAILFSWETSVQKHIKIINDLCRGEA